jgi:hypothetical protein
VVSRRGIHAFAAKHGLAIREEYGQAIALRDAKPLGALLVNSVVGALGAVSLGRLASDHSNLTYVLEKRPVREEAAVTYFILASLAALTLGLLAILGVRKALWTIWPLCALLLPSNLAFTPPGGIRVSPQLIPLLLLPALLSSASREAGRRGLRWCLADTLMLLMFVCQNISNINNNKYYNLTTLWLFLAWVAPYILGRLYLSSEQDLAWALRPLCVCLAALCLFMVVESLTGLNPLKMATRVGYPEGRSATRAEGYVRALHARDT